MSSIALEAQKDIAIVRLDNGVTNAVSRTLVEDLSDALEKVKSEFSGMVLAGGTKFFSIGLNVPELLELNRREMTEFWHRFNIDMVLESDELEDKAIKNTAEIAIFDSQALSAIKANRVEEICLKFEKHHKEKHEMFID